MNSRTTFTVGSVVFRIHWLILLCVLLAMSGLVRLGVWQMGRAQEKIAEQESFVDSGQLQATPLAEVPTAGIEFDSLQHQNRRVVMRGEYLNAQSIFLIYQTYQGQIGWEIVTPFRVQDQQLIALVSRGWNGTGSYEALAAALPVVEGEVEVQGQIFVPTASMAAKTNGDLDIKWPLVMRYLNTTELAPLFDAPLFPYVIRLAEDQPGVLVRHWPAVMVDAGRNFSYALQWFAMAIAVGIVSLILSSNALQLWQRKRKPL
jgi:cytochrome oxidase assembly protein ShyY1